jgi:hypothetical protein
MHDLIDLHVACDMRATSPPPEGAMHVQTGKSGTRRHVVSEGVHMRTIESGTKLHTYGMRSQVSKPCSGFSLTINISALHVFMSHQPTLPTETFRADHCMKQETTRLLQEYTMPKLNLSSGV